MDVLHDGVAIHARTTHHQGVSRLAVTAVLAASAVAAAAPGIGTAHPVRLLAASPDARWAVICEARADTDHDGTISVSPGFNGLYGDQMEAFLVEGDGAGTPIDDLIDSDATGRFLVILRDAKLVLVDTTKRAEVALTGAYADPARDRPSGAYLGVSFDPTGKHLSYVALVKGQAVVRVRDLFQGTEVTVDPGPGKLWSARLDGGHVLVEMLVPHNGSEVAYPSDRAPGNYRVRRCATRTSSDVIERTGDTPILRIASVTGGTAADAPDFLAALGTATLKRTTAGALVLEDATGTHELLPAACKARVRQVNVEHRLVLAFCTADGDKATLQLVGVDVHRIVNPHGSGSNDDYFGPFGRHVLSTTNDADDTIYDVVTGKSRITPHNQRWLASLGDRTLVSRHGHLILLDDTSESDLGDIGTEYPTMYEAGTIRLVAPFVVDLATGKVIGRVPERDIAYSPGSKLVYHVSASVTAVATDGRMLGAFTIKPSGFPDGPLQWLTPAHP